MLDSTTIEAPSQEPTENIEKTMDQDTGLPSDIMKEIEASDPEYAQMRKSSAEAKAEAEKKQSAGEKKEGEVDQSPEEENPDEKLPPEGEEEKPEEEKPEGGEELPDEEQSTNAEFADNVIEGTTGEDFSKLPENVQEALGKFVQKNSEESGRVKELQEKLDKLLADPIASDRAKLIDEGKSSESYVAQGLTPQEKQYLKEHVLLDDDDLAKLESGIDAIANAKAEAIVKNKLMDFDQRNKVADINRRGQDMLLGLSKFNKSLELKEKDLNKLLEQKEKHPEWDKYVNGIGKIQQWAAKMRIGYDKALEMGEKAFYAAAAAGLDMPVAINTQERDKKMVAETRKKALAPFLKGSTGKALKTGASSADRSKIEKTVTDGGYDVVRLANDADYYEEALNRKYGDQKHKDYIDSLVEKGSRIASERKVRK